VDRVPEKGIEWVDTNRMRNVLRKETQKNKADRNVIKRNRICFNLLNSQIHRVAAAA
jgi:hypothetical protein